MKCTTPSLTEEQIKEPFEQVLVKLVAEGAVLDEKIAELDAKITEMQRSAERIDLFIQVLDQAGEAFTEDLWCIMVDKVTVSPQGGMKFCLTCGMNVEI